jgi:hypothetical protein
LIVLSGPAAGVADAVRETNPMAVWGEFVDCADAASNLFSGVHAIWRSTDTTIGLRYTE